MNKSKKEYIEFIYINLKNKYKFVKYDVLNHSISFHFGQNDYVSFFNISNEAIESYRKTNKIPYSIQKLLKDKPHDEFTNFFNPS